MECFIPYELAMNILPKKVVSMKKNGQQLKPRHLRDFGAYSVVHHSCAMLVKVMFLFSVLFQPLISNAEEITVDSQDQLEISRIKSAYLYNFLKYVQFNHGEQVASPNEYSVCVLGKDPFGSALDAMSGRSAKGASVKVKRIADIAQANTCQIIYVSESEHNNLSSIFDSLKSSSILTVSDIDNFANLGGIIGFTGEQKKIGIEINLTNARQSNIRISALLLEIARIID